jgi:hypothetical protein
MKTKTLLIAAAALVAGVVSSEAQVYSANIVGYANVVLPGNGQYTLIANPFDDGNGNHLTNLLTAALPGGTAAVRSTLFYYPGAPTTINKLAAGWSLDAILTPGVGFYVRNGAPGGNAPTLTNTFVGTIVVAPGASVTNTIPNGFSLQGSTLPLAGNIAVVGTPSGDPNLNYGGAFYSISAGAGISKIQTWNTGTQSPVTVNKTFATGNWAVTVPVTVGQGFWLINQSPATNMVQTLP